MNKELLQKAINIYGREAQQDMCIEEMSELTKAICKAKRNRYYLTTQIKENLYEEIADVYIMLEQLVMMYDCESEVKKQIANKLARLESRLREND